MHKIALYFFAISHNSRYWIGRFWDRSPTLQLLLFLLLLLLLLLILLLVILGQITNTNRQYRLKSKLKQPVISVVDLHSAVLNLHCVTQVLKLCNVCHFLSNCYLPLLLLLILLTIVKIGPILNYLSFVIRLLPTTTSSTTTTTCSSTTATTSTTNTGNC